MMKKLLKIGLFQAKKYCSYHRFTVKFGEINMKIIVCVRGKIISFFTGICMENTSGMEPLCLVCACAVHAI